jgi:hypothetical protein
LNQAIAEEAEAYISFSFLNIIFFPCFVLRCHFHFPFNSYSSIVPQNFWKKEDTAREGKEDRVSGKEREKEK